MNRSLTAEDVLRDIEFELVQGAISKDELGQGIQAVKKYQNKLRGELFEGDALSKENRDVVSRQFQINDMLTTLLQEMAAKIQTIRLELHQTKGLSQRLSQPKTNGHRSECEPEIEIEIEIDRPSNLPQPTSTPAPIALDQELLWRPPTEVEEAMREEALQIQMDVRAASIPIVGSMVKRVRMALHNLTLFYTGKLAMKQAAINRTYGDWLLDLNEQNLHQQEQIANLTQQVLALQERIEQMEQQK
ncbi:MAG: hypothetical protein ACPGWR_14965 [Ardenticatenaceae bacterium]